MFLKDISHINAGYPFRGKLPEASGSGIYCIQMKDLSQELNINWAEVVEVLLTGKRKPDFLQAGDILFSARGNINTAYCFNEALAAKTVCAPYFFHLRILPQFIKSVLPAFVAWQLNQLPAQRYFLKEAEGSVTKSIRRSVLENTPMVIPGIRRQLKIVSLYLLQLKEKQTYQALINNSQQMMNHIALELQKEKAPKGRINRDV